MNALLAVVMVCAATVAAPDCTRDNALDIVVQPVALPTTCAMVGEVMATRMPLAPGQYHKVACERRKAVS